MQLISVNIGQAKDMSIANRKIKTGIYKESINTTIYISKDGLKGDTICDTRYHGGVDQAVYIYGTNDYNWWAEFLGQKISPGTFGDNLTISDLESSSFSIGDQLFVGDVILEISAPRIPCSTLTTRMNDPAFAKKYKNAERPGLYCRVLKEGNVTAGDPVTLKKYDQPTVSILEMFREWFHPLQSKEEIKRYLQAPIAIRDRIDKEKKLKKLSTL